MSKRDYTISKKAGATMWTCEVTDSYGETHTNYFETARRCSEHVYYIWEKEISPLQAEHLNDELLSKAIEECIQMDIDRGVEPSLD